MNAGGADITYLLWPMMMMMMMMVVAIDDDADDDDAGDEVEDEDEGSFRFTLYILPPAMLASPPSILDSFCKYLSPHYLFSNIHLPIHS